MLPAFDISSNVLSHSSQFEQFIIGSDVPNNCGLGIGVYNNLPIVETIRGGFHVDNTITACEWYWGVIDSEVSFVADAADDPCRAVLIFDGQRSKGIE